MFVAITFLITCLRLLSLNFQTCNSSPYIETNYTIEIADIAFSALFLLGLMLNCVTHLCKLGNGTPYSGQINHIPEPTVQCVAVVCMWALPCFFSWVPLPRAVLCAFLHGPIHFECLIFKKVQVKIVEKLKIVINWTSVLFILFMTSF